MVLVGSSLRAAAEATVTELSLEDGGVQRVLFISPANPTESPHSHFGIEQETVEHVAQWIRAVSKP
jgi:hypothetical protein